MWPIPATTSAVSLTQDREAALRTLRAAAGIYRAPSGSYTIGLDEAIQIESGRRDVLTVVVNRECAGVGNSANDQVRCAQNVETEARGVARDAQQRADTTLADLEGLVDALARLDGPKHVVVLTGGAIGANSVLPFVTRISDKAAGARVTLHAIQFDQGTAQANIDQIRAPAEQVDQASSATVALATSTGGLAITPASGEVGFQQLARSLSASYVLAFEAVPGDRDGQLHRIEVKVRSASWGGVVRARSSYRITASGASPYLGGGHLRPHRPRPPHRARRPRCRRAPRRWTRSWRCSPSAPIATSVTSPRSSPRSGTSR